MRKTAKTLCALGAVLTIASCSGPAPDSLEARRERNELSDYEANYAAAGRQPDPQLENELRESEEIRRWQERVRPTPHGAFPKIGTCYNTRVKEVMGRLGGDPSGDSGSAVLFENGLYQVDYEVVPGIVHSHTGDKVRMCVIELPKNCPPGDFRGIVYRTHNYRTGEDWELPDSHHECGGA